MNKQVNFFRVLNDAIKDFGKFKLCIILFASTIVLFLFVYYFLNLGDLCYEQRKTLLLNLNDVILAVFPALLGFSITGHSIILTCSEEARRRLKITADDGKIPYNVICGTCVICHMINILTIMLSMIVKFHYTEYLVYFITILAISIFIILVDLSLHLYASKSAIRVK